MRHDDAILAERAKKLAAPQRGRSARLNGHSAALFARGGVAYAIETAYVLQVVRVLAPTPLPLTHPCWRGLTTLHGELLAVLDLPRLLEDDPADLLTVGSAREDGELETLLVMVIGRDRPEFGLLLDALLEARELEQVVPLASREGGTGLLRGATADGVRVVEAELLLADPRLSLATSEPSNS